MPSPILGPMGEPGEGELAPAPPAPQSEIAAPALEEVKAPEPKPAPPSEMRQPIPEAPEPAPEKKPEPVKQPQIEAPQKPEEAKQETPKAEQPKPEPKKIEEKKAEPKKPEPKKPEPSKTPPKKTPPKPDPVTSALQKARKAASRSSSGDPGNAIEQALAQAQRSASGARGGGGGEGVGPGGGGLINAYAGQIMLAVRSNWGFASSKRGLNLVCTVRVQLDMNGAVLDAVVTQSSGNSLYDASVVNAIKRAGQAGLIPPPPDQSSSQLDLVFSYDQFSALRSQ